jgi:hypothetical protein
VKLRNDSSARSEQRRRAESAFTLVEVMVGSGLLLTLIVGCCSAIFAMDLSSRRLADYTAAMAVVQAKIEDVRGATYKPPNSPFGLTTTYVTNTDYIDLDQAGATFRVSGTVISKFEPVAAGHLVTVTGTFQTSSKPLTVTLQTIVNQYSGGQQ